MNLALAATTLTERSKPIMSLCACFQTLQAEARAWQERRDEEGGKIEWRFSTDDARIKLERLYPLLQG